ncbi:MAG: hypothetical protein C0393_00425 [Anaerolinea sp.]|nr:hypothetical protein [Anaerolinea sp.]
MRNFAAESRGSDRSSEAMLDEARGFLRFLNTFATFVFLYVNDYTAKRVFSRRTHLHLQQVQVSGRCTAETAEYAEI